MYKTLSDLPTPAFVINRHAFAENCQRVIELVKERHLKLRPHIKTHKTLEGVSLQAYGNVEGKSLDCNNGVITGFVASTIPEVKLLVNFLTSSSATQSTRTLLSAKETCDSTPSCSHSILYGVPISATKLPALKALQDQLNQWDRFQQGRRKSNKETERSAESKNANSNSCQLIPNHKIHILMDHEEQVRMVEDFFRSQKQQGQETGKEIETSSFSVFIKLDTGYHRAGTTCDEKGLKLVDAITHSANLKLVGFYSHCGHAYDIEDQLAIEEITKRDVECFQHFLQKLEEHWESSSRGHTLAGLTLSVGSTPSLFHHCNPSLSIGRPSTSKATQEWWRDFFKRYPDAILEIHPGNYTLFDRQQQYTKACAGEKNIAGRVMTRVIGHYDDIHRPQTILMDAGATALTKETTPQGCMAEIASYYDKKHGTGHSMEVYKMSQEVSMARARSLSTPSENEKRTVLKDFPLGSLIALLPNHSCLAAACFDKYYVINDATCQFAPDAPIVDEWDPVKGW